MEGREEGRKRGRKGRRKAGGGRDRYGGQGVS